MKNLIPFLILATTLLIIGDAALARDLAGSAKAAQSQLNMIGVAGIGIGFTLGGLAFVAGLPHIGKGILASAAVGAACILGQPLIVQFFSKIFGSLS